MNTTNLLSFFNGLNNFLALPGSVLFLGVAIILTLKSGFAQIRTLPRFVRIIMNGMREEKHKQKEKHSDTISPLHALFAALGTSIGMGNIVGPTIAIAWGGPGALFWLVVYIFFASVTKFTEVTFALYTRVTMQDGKVVGGPMVYLKMVSIFLAHWYGFIMSVLFISWSANQSNTLASIYAIEGVPHWIIGFGLAILTAITLSGGARRVGIFASKLVPIMFVLYVSFSLFILFKDIAAFKNALHLIKDGIFNSTAAVGGFAGATIFQAIRFGTFFAIYISESGMGTSSIPHAMSDIKRPVDQGILAMGSTVADMLLSILSGLLVLVTGIWQVGFCNTLIYQVFKMHAPLFGQVVLLISVSLFVMTTVIGNSFNGMKSFSVLFHNRWVTAYIILTVVCIFIGSLMPVPLVWEIMSTLLTLAAVPNLIGLLILSFKYPQVLSLKQE
ncbi:MAG: alanine:cation symporter family protein [bacterium]|nr:alanine:cation symporter family protein [bacterium]